MRWIDHFTGFDGETTGVGKRACLVEFACVHFVRGRKVASWSTFLNPPSVDWEDEQVKEALKVNGIRREQLKDAPTFKEIAPTLMDELGAAIWVAHNAPFDMRILEYEFQRLGAPMPWRPGLLVDTQALAMKLDGARPFTKGYKLLDVAARLGVTPGGAHRAEVDATTCGEILVALGPKLPVRARELAVYLGAAA